MQSPGVSDTLKAGLCETSHLKIFCITPEAVYLCKVVLREEIAVWIEKRRDKHTL